MAATVCQLARRLINVLGYEVQVNAIEVLSSGVSGILAWCMWLCKAAGSHCLQVVHSRLWCSCRNKVRQTRQAGGRQAGCELLCCLIADFAVTHGAMSVVESAGVGVVGCCCRRGHGFLSRALAQVQASCVAIMPHGRFRNSFALHLNFGYDGWLGWW